MTAGCSTKGGLFFFRGCDHRSAQGKTFYEVPGGGKGARHDRDGMCVVRPHMSNVMNTPAEVIEANYPILIEQQALRRGSGGKGVHCGGDGQIRTYLINGPQVAMTSMVERCIIPPFGLKGGEAGKTFNITLKRASGETMNIAGKTHLRLQQGDRIIMKTSGGGGYGAPVTHDSQERT